MLPVLNGILAYGHSRYKIPNILFTIVEIFLTICILCAVATNIVAYHLIIDQTVPLKLSFYLILGMVQLFYIRNYSKISYVFLTSLVTLIIMLITYTISYDFVSTMPIYWYYLIHLLVLLGWDHNEAMGILRKQTWVNKIQILETILPKKNIGIYLLSCIASFCYASLNLCVLLSYKTMGIAEHIALTLTIVILVLTGMSSYSLLVKYDTIGDEQFPGCLLIHYIKQAYNRCNILVYGSMQIKTTPKFTFKALLFALLLIIDGLSCTAFAAVLDCGEAPNNLEPSSPIAEPSSPIAEGNASSSRQSYSLIGSIAQGVRDIPRVTTSTGGAALIATGGATLCSAITGAFDAEQTAQIEDPLQALQARVAQLEKENSALKLALEKKQNKNLIHGIFKCFTKSSNK
jgi:hypothetical protein